MLQLLFFKPKNQGSLSDEELLATYRQRGDKEILGELFKRYAHLVYGVCMKYLKNPDDAQDLSMEVFEKLFTDLRHHKISNFRSWLYMVSKNQCLMHLRREKGHLTVELQEESSEDEENNPMEKLPSGHPDEEEDLKEINLQVLEEGLLTLNHEQKVCVELFYLQNKSYAEVAVITGFDLKQVKSFIQNGKRNLRIYMEKKNA